jgi:hypothetical protein
MIRIVNYQKLEMTDTEYQIFKNICQSYDDPPSRKGIDLFKDLFVANDQGIIITLIPPSKNYTTLEVYLFLQTLMLQQHLRCMYSMIEEKNK